MSLTAQNSGGPEVAREFEELIDEILQIRQDLVALPKESLDVLGRAESHVLFAVEACFRSSTARLDARGSPMNGTDPASISRRVKKFCVPTLRLSSD